MGKPQTRLSEAQKSSVCDYHKKNAKLKLSEIGKWAQKEFKLSSLPDRSTIGRIVKNSTRYESIQPQNAKLLKARVIPYEALVEAMAIWVLQMEHRKICLSDDLIQKKALELATMMNIAPIKFRASNGWLYNFKK